MTQDDWTSRLVGVIAQEVRRYRQAQKLSAQQLADRTAEIGMPINRSVLANLESGRRDTVSVAELFVLAAALRVPPLLLTFPAGRVETVEAIPGVEITPWDALFWGSGESTQADIDALRDESGVVKLISGHHQRLGDLYSELSEYMHHLEYMREGPSDTLHTASKEIVARISRSLKRQADELGRHRQAMVAADLVAPEIPSLVRALIEDGTMPTEIQIKDLFDQRRAMGLR